MMKRKRPSDQEAKRLSEAIAKYRNREYRIALREMERDLVGFDYAAN